MKQTQTSPQHAPTGTAEPVDPETVATIRAHGLAAESARELSTVLGLMSEPTRLRILYALDRVDEVCVGDLALALGLSDDAVSYALRLLRTARLVESRRCGRSVVYRLAQDFPEPLLDHCWMRVVELSSTTKDIA